MTKDWFGFGRTELVHALRMTAASLIAFVLAYVFGRSEGLWAVITAIAVTQSSVGGSVRTAFEQFVGSLFGAVYATGVALAIRPDDPLSSAATLAAALAPPSVMAAISPGFRIAPMTAAIMLLGYAGPNVGPVDMAAGRMIEVGLGCAVGVIVSILVMPTRAATSVGDVTSRLADLLAGQLEALAEGPDAAGRRIGFLAARTREELILLAELMDEAGRERRIWLSDAPDITPLLRTMRRLRHDVDMLRRAVREAGQEQLSLGAVDSWVRAAEMGAAVLRKVGPAISDGQRLAGSSADMEQAVRVYRAALEEMRRTGELRALSTGTLGRLFGIGFALEQFRRDLDDLLRRVDEFSAPPRGRRRR